MIQLVLGSVLFLILSYSTNQSLCNALPRLVYLALLFPGIALHELSHAIAVLLTGGHVADINFFSSTGGHVLHTPSKIPVLGQFLISFAPVIFGLFSIYVLAKYLPVHQTGLLHIPWSDWELPKIGLVNGFHLWQILVIYLLISISITLVPSRQDISASVAGIFAVLVIVVLMYQNDWLKITPTMILYIWYINIGLVIVAFATMPLKLIKKRR